MGEGLATASGEGSERIGWIRLDNLRKSDLIVIFLRARVPHVIREVELRI